MRVVGFIAGPIYRETRVGRFLILAIMHSQPQPTIYQIANRKDHRIYIQNVTHPGSAGTCHAIFVYFHGVLF